MVAPVGGAGKNATYYELNEAYKPHVLPRSAFNMCHGSFGGVHGKEFICVQSLDGQLFVLEQDNFAFTRYLADFLLPGPLCYVPHTDSFVTTNSTMQLQAYKYSSLGAASHSRCVYVCVCV
jgi:Bardet-Biedl syndrome 9 protein